MLYSLRANDRSVTGLISGATGVTSPVPDAMPASYAIRTLSADDVCTHLDAFLAIAGDAAGEYWGETNRLMDLPDKWRLSFALWSNNRPVAYAVLSRKAPDLVHLHHLMVLPELRGEGWGGRLVGEMESRARGAGCARLTLKVRLADARAHAFYVRLGYAETGVEAYYALLGRDL